MSSSSSPATRDFGGGSGRETDDDKSADLAPSAPPPAAASGNRAAATATQLARHIREGAVGDDALLPTPLGPRKITYADHTASGRALASIERYVAESVLPLYANTHTTTSQCGFQSFMFLSEARDTVRDCVNASERDDVVLFTGRGATAASNMLAHFLAPPGPQQRVAAGSSGGASGSSLLAGQDGAPLASVAECQFPSCGRRFASSSDLLLHARTHPDGEQTAQGGGYGAAAAAAAAAAAFSVAAGQAGEPVASPQQQQLHLRAHSSGPGSFLAAAAPLFHVVVGPYVHHSSLLPWREAGAQIHMLSSEGRSPAQPPLSGGADGVDSPSAAAASRGRTEGGLDLLALDALLREIRTTPVGAPAADSPLLSAVVVCVFTAASNITGARCDHLVQEACAVAHAHGALAVWDYAAAAPHVRMNVSPGTSLSVRDLLHRERGALRKGTSDGEPAAPAPGAAASFSTAIDALYFSPHKLMGGPGSPGVLVVKRRLLGGGRAPFHPGGGTVYFVHPDGTPRYLANDAEREEGGSPDTLGAVRAALSLRLLRSVGYPGLGDREWALGAVARRAWAAHPNIRLLGGPGAEPAADGCACCRPSPGSPLPILSLAFLAAPCAGGATTGLLHHWGFIAALLNDLFGIQARGGCLCAGPYAHSLLGVSPALAAGIEACILTSKDELLRPGVVRLDVPFHASHAAFRFVVDAVLWVADHASEMLHLYTPTAETGEWRMHRSGASALLREAYASGSVMSGLGAPVPPREVIAAATGACGEGALGHGAAAQRGGGTKAHPRRWLQELQFGEDGAARSPSYASSLRLAGAGDEGDGMTEAQLYAAYLGEATLLSAAVRKLRVPRAEAGWASLTPTTHNPAALLSAHALPLRWFALAGDVHASATGSGAAAGEGAGAGSTPASRLAALPTLRPGPLELCGSCASSGGGSRAALVLLLSTPAAELSRDALEAWDGKPIPAAAGGAAPAPPPVAPSPSPPPPQLMMMVQQQQLQQQQLQQQQQAPALPASGSVAAASLGSSSTQAAPAAPAAPVSFEAEAVSSSPPSAPPPPSTSASPGPRGDIAALIAFRRDPVLRATFAAVAALPQAPPRLLRVLTSQVHQAMTDFNMVRDGDHLLLGLSGGKDSLSLLMLLVAVQARAPIRFRLSACTVDPQYPGFDPSPLIGFCASLGIPYHYESQAVIAAAAEHMGKDSICSWCSRMKRGILYTVARRVGATTLVLGQHLDDFAESFVMSAFRNGLLRTMKAAYTNDAGDIRIIRPLVYSRERATRAYADARALPVISENCPACYTGPTERYHVKKLLAAEEAVNPNLFSCLMRAMLPLMTSEGSAAVRLHGLPPALAASREHAPASGDGEDAEGEGEEQAGGGAGSLQRGKKTKQGAAQQVGGPLGAGSGGSSGVDTRHAGVGGGDRMLSPAALVAPPQQPLAAGKEADGAQRALSIAALVEAAASAADTDECFGDCGLRIKPQAGGGQMEASAAAGDAMASGGS